MKSLITIERIVRSSLQSSKSLQRFISKSLQRFTAKDLRRFTAKNLQRFTTKGLQRFTAKDLQSFDHFTTKDVQRFTTKDLQRFTAKDLQSFDHSVAIQFSRKPSIKKLLSLALFICCTNFASAQSTKITGAIQGEGDELIAGATVMLIGAQDSILKSYSITNKEGVFTMSGIKVGDYILKASFFGFLPYEQEVTVSQLETPLNLGSIKLKPKVLDKVVVDGAYVPIQIKGDTIEYDARAFETKEHDVVEDLLEQLPGVEVEADGTIKVQGEEVTEILVDGEQFFGDDPKIASKNLPANAVAKVQVFDKKSDMADFTGVDDGSESPTINIKLKESHKKGVFGNLEAGLGVDYPYQDQLRYQGKGNVHYFQKKWQISLIGMSNNVNETGFSFSDYMNFMGGAQSIDRRSGGGFQSSGLASSGDSDDGFLTTHASGLNFTFKPSKQTNLSASIFLNAFDKTYNKVLERQTYFTDSTLNTNEVLSQNSSTLNNRGDIRLEQKFDSTHFLNINFSGNWNDADYYNGSFVENFNSGQQRTSDFNTNLNQAEFAYDFSVDAEYRKKFKKAGRFTGGGLGFSATNNDANTTLSYLNTLYAAGISTDIFTDQNQLLLNKTGGLSGEWLWSEPISKRQLLQPKYSFSRNTESINKAVFDNVSESRIFNDLLSADATYIKTAHNFQLKHKFIGNSVLTTVGADYKLLSLSGESIFDEPQLFQYVLPSARIQWDPTKNSNVRLNYNTTITTPSLSQLQPLPDNTNPSEITLGNVNLIPEYNQNLSLRYRRFNQFNFTFIMASISGKYVTNNITYSQNINSFLVREIIPENLGTEKSLSTYLVYGTSLYALKTKFNIKGNVSVANGQVNLNGLADQYTSYNFNPKITIENINKKVFNIRTGFGYNYSINNYKDNTAFNTNFSNWNYYGDFTVFLKDRWVLNTDLSHFFYPDFEENQQLILLNAKIACNLLESRKLQVYVSGNDLLNQNTGINQYFLQNIYEQEVTETLARYFMVGLKYSFQKLGAE